MSLTPQDPNPALHQAMQDIAAATPPLLDALRALSAAELAALYEAEVEREEAEREGDAE
jgi:hypothetical protein